MKNTLKTAAAAASLSFLTATNAAAQDAAAPETRLCMEINKSPAGLVEVKLSAGPAFNTASLLGQRITLQVANAPQDVTNSPRILALVDDPATPEDESILNANILAALETGGTFTVPTNVESVLNGTGKVFGNFQIIAPTNQ